MFRKIIIIILATCCLVIPLQAVQHSPPWADNYDFNYTPPIVLPNYTLDTRYSANDAANKQDLMGYDGHANTDCSAGQAFNALPDDAMFSFHGHGDNYRLLFVNQTAQSEFHISDYGYRVPGRYYLSDFNNGELNDVLFMLFDSCHSAEINNTYGNWLTMSRSKGVDNPMGFQEDISNNKSIYWNNKFWYYCNQYNVYISGAATLATRESLLYCPPIGQYGGVDSWALNGSWLTELKPARYGT